MNEIKIKCDVKDYLSLESLCCDLQGELKSITQENKNKLKNSILDKGFIAPLFIYKTKTKNYLIDGNMRYRVLTDMQEEGYDIPNLPVVYIQAISLKDARKKLLAVASQFGDVDKHNLHLFLQDVNIEPQEIRLLKTEINISISKETDGDDEIPEEVEPITKRGNLWGLGEHSLMCGDSTDAEQVDRLLDGNTIDMVFTDPPYGVAIGDKNKFLDEFQKSGRNKKNIENDCLKPGDLKEILLKAFIIIKEKMADHCTVFLTAPQGGELGMMMMMMKEAGLPIKHVLMWYKNSPTFSLGRLDYDYQHEPILLTWGKKHKRPMNGQHKTSVWKIDKPRSSKKHPTMKPVELYENAYLNNSDKNDLVYEPFSGSGTAFLAAEKTGRRCFGMEIDPHYCDVIVQRYKDWCEKNGIEHNIKLNRENWNG